MKVLLIEDDPVMAAYVERGLKQEGHVVDVAANGTDGMHLSADRSYGVLIVDRMLPGGDGLSMVKSLRASGIRTPVLFLTTLGGIDDRVAGLEAGGDDYLVKPFAFSELVARLNALSRRPPIAESDAVLRVHDLEVDRLARTVRRGGEKIDVQPREFSLLEYLMKNAGRVVTKTMLLENVWHFHFDPKTNIVETHISRLRSKVDRNRGIELIHTIRGSGYVIREPE
ncbi:MAG: response regulator transcription factor [Hyphomicrobiaceae bacterium]